MKTLICFTLLTLCITTETKPLDHSVNYSNKQNDSQRENKKITQLKQNNDSENFDNIEGDDLNDFPTTTTSVPSNSSINSLLISFFDKIRRKSQLASQIFLQDRLEFFKNVLSTLGLLSANNNNTSSYIRRIFTPSGLAQLIGIDNDEFYTNRLDPAGFFSGNGWFANKGGLLGGPGAIFSTGSALTDYPSAYRKK